METVVSGIRSTSGSLHLGNYLGALKNFVQMQHQNNCYFFIADYHALTTHPNAAEMHTNARKVIIEYLAAGLDPEVATLYLQSDLPETAELYLFLNMVSYLGELERSASFKEKVRKHPDNVNAGLLTYPVLMAADIILHKATKVPVGKDQEQHLEMTRTFAGRFNSLYKVDYFPEPQAYNFGNELVKVPSLDGTGKMSKSDNPNSAIFFSDDADLIRKKVMKAVTSVNVGPTEEEPNKPEVVENLFTLMKHVSAPETVQHFEDMWNNSGMRYGDMKKQLAEDMVAFVTPISERIKELEADNDYIRKVVNMGKEKAKASAQQTINEVREIIGFKKF
jgi:tryptophanyl-tRNA synthetase